MKISYVLLAACLLWGVASADIIMVNGVNYNTDDLANNAIVVHFPADVIASIKPGEDGITTSVSVIDQLNQNLNAEYFRPLFPGAYKKGNFQLAGYYSVGFSGKSDLAEIILAYQELALADNVEPIPLNKIDFAPNDPSFGSQWGMEKIQAENAWDVCQGDTDVHLAIADTGVDWDHPDLADHVWINEDDPIDGLDNDDNGYIDDYRGWDWVDGVTGYDGEDEDDQDNDPMDFNGHGTHCAGISAACTNNGVGVAGIGFDCHIMCLRIGWMSTDGNGYVRMDFAAPAIVYAADKGAKSINCSWGSSYASYLRDAVDYAVENEVVVVSAAGNDGADDSPYLGTREDVLAVAATNQSDVKASFSNYGSWVDVSAPGVGIYSTYFDDSYASLEGTSMAAPFVTGLAALVSACNPTFDRAAIFDKICSTADSIDDLNPDYEGRLGSGRINAYAAVASHIYPNFTVTSDSTWLVNDDDDGILNPGETFDLVITILNEWSSADSVIATAHSNDYFTAIDSVTELGSVSNDEEISNADQPFSMQAVGSIVPGDWPVAVTITASNGFTQELEIIVTVSLNQLGFPLSIAGNIESSPLIYDCDDDGANEILVGASDANLYMIEANGQYSSGWPQAVSDGITNAPAAGDIDNDGSSEIIAASKDGYVYAWENNGTLLSGFPVDIEGTVYGAAILADLDGNNDLEIVVGSMSNHNIYVINHDGSQFSWSPFAGTAGWYGSPAAADFDGDGDDEVVFAGLDSKVHVLNGDGQELSGFPITLAHSAYASVALAQTTFDGLTDIVVVTNQGELYLINSTGNIEYNYPIDLEATVLLPPVVTNLYDYSQPNIVVIDNSGNIHAVELNGYEPGDFPITIDGAAKSGPAVADIDGDGSRDIVIGCASGITVAYSIEGELLPNFPITSTCLGDIKSTPAIGDLDSDGDLEIVWGVSSSEAGNLMVIDYKANSSVNEFDWPYFGCNPQRQSCYYYEEEAVSVDDDGSLPVQFSLLQNYPNPFNPSTTISFSLPQAAEANINIYDILGRNIETISVGLLAAGTHSVTWHADKYSSGVYFYKIQAGDFSDVKKCLLIK